MYSDIYVYMYSDMYVYMYVCICMIELVSELVSEYVYVCIELVTDLRL